MKVLCIADHIDPVIYSANLKARFADVDLVLSAGDLSLEYYDFIVSTLNKPLLFVFGNHHLEGWSEYRHDPFEDAPPAADAAEFGPPELHHGSSITDVPGGGLGTGIAQARRARDWARRPPRNRPPCDIDAHFSGSG